VASRRLGHLDILEVTGSARGALAMHAARCLVLPVRAVFAVILRSLRVPWLAELACGTGKTEILGCAGLVLPELAGSAGNHAGVRRELAG